MPLVRMPFTDHSSEFLGTLPYFAMPAPQPPSVRSQALPPITAPARGAFGWRKTALPPQVTQPGFTSAALTPQGPNTYSSTGGIVRTS